MEFSRKSLSGLDAASPLWCRPNQVSVDRRLESSDAAYVQGIHTADGTLNGCPTDYGKQDFFINGGKSKQPGCDDNICSHYKAVEYYRKSLIKANVYEGCDYLFWKSNNCLNAPNKARLGIYNTNFTPGRYYLSMN